jgi:hypothetical protein
MNNLNLLIFVALAITFPIQAQKMSDAEATYALVGPVHTFRTEVATFVKKDGQYVEGPRVLQMTATFNEDGNRTELGMYNDKGVLSRRIETRFDGPRMTEFLNYDGAGRMWLRGTYLYEDGRVKEQTNYNGDGSVRSKSFIKRNSKGQLLERTEQSGDGVLMQKVTNSFDGDSLITSERSLYYTDGSLREKVTHDIPQKRSETVTFKPDGSVETKSVRVNQEITQRDGDGSLVKTTTISGEGRLVDEVLVNKDGTSKRQSEVPDQLDDHGNWIKKTNLITDANGTRPLKVTYRTITYYEK